MWKYDVFSLLFLIAINIMVSPCAFAALGDDIGSTMAEQSRFTAAPQILPQRGYSIHERQTATGSTVREFVSTQGTIFGVSWRGAAPDLKQLLGRYFDQYIAAANSQPARRGRGMHIEIDDLIFDSGGHMRFVTGRAFLRNKLPEGVSANDVH